MPPFGNKMAGFCKIECVFSAYFCLFFAKKSCVFVQNRTDGDAKHRANAHADHFADVGKMIGQLPNNPRWLFRKLQQPHKAACFSFYVTFQIRWSGTCPEPQNAPCVKIRPLPDGIFNP